MRVNLCHCRFHGAKGVVVDPPSCHLVDFRNLPRDCPWRFPTGQFFQPALEFRYGILVRPALPLFHLAVLVEAKAKIFQLLRSRDVGLGHVDF